MKLSKIHYFVRYIVSALVIVSFTSAFGMTCSADRFTVVRDGQTIFDDNFDGSTLPPAAPSFAGAPATYGQWGELTESNGRLILDTAHGTPSIPGGGGATPYMTSNVTLRTGTTGLTSSNTFSVTAVFDIPAALTADAANSACLLRLIDSSGSVDPFNVRDEVRIGASVNASGGVAMVFSHYDRVTNVVTTIGSKGFDPSHTQVTATLAKNSPTSNDITATYAYVDNGVQGTTVSLGSKAIFSDKPYTKPGLVLSKKMDAPIKMTALAISGSTSVPSNGVAQYMLTATYDDGSTRRIYIPTWSASNQTLTIDSTGSAVATSVAADTPVRVSALYGDGSNTLTAVLDVVVHPATIATPTSYTLSVTTSGSGSGNVTSTPANIDCGNTCTAAFPSASNVTLTATPVAGFTFWGWSGACTGTGTCTVTMNAAKNVTATFNPIPFSVLTAGVTDGVITAPIATVTTTIQFNPPDVGKTGSVFITALVPANALGAFGITQSGTKSLRSVAINAVTDSSAPVLIQLTPSGWQPVTNGQLIPYATGVLGDQLAAQTILKSTDTSNLKGTQICLGYGTSVADMTANSKMQLVAIVPDPNATNPNTGSCLITPWSISASNQGAGAQDVTLQIVFTPDLSDRNSPLNLYVAGLFGGQYYFVTQTNSNINVVQYSGGSLPVYSVGNGANLTTQGWTIPLGDLTTLHGLQIYTGLGRSDSDMLNKGQVKLIYSVN